MQKISYTREEKFEGKYVKDKKYCNVRNHCHYTGEYKCAVHSMCNLKYIVSEEISIVFHNESNYDYNFIMK